MSVVIIEATPEEVEALKRAIARNCTCDPETTTRRCALCTAATEDRVWLSHMLFARRLRATFEKGELSR